MNWCRRASDPDSRVARRKLHFGEPGRADRRRLRRRPASWRWLFLVNIPLMALALWRVGRLPLTQDKVRRRGSRRTSRRPDLCGGSGHHAGLGHLRRTPVPVVLYAKWPAHRWCCVALGALRTHGAAAVRPFLPIELMRDRGIAWMAATVVLLRAASLRQCSSCRSICSSALASPQAIRACCCCR